MHRDAARQGQDPAHRGRYRPLLDPLPFPLDEPQRRSVGCAPCLPVCCLGLVRACRRMHARVAPSP